jgi:hypothetical protein
MVMLCVRVCACVHVPPEQGGGGVFWPTGSTEEVVYCIYHILTTPEVGEVVSAISFNTDHVHLPPYGFLRFL